MCCFSGRVVHVTGTEIFARAAPRGRQYLVYRMGLELVDDVAMILPLPVPARSADDAVTFLDLSSYGDFFADLQHGFQMAAGFGPPLSGGFAPQAAPLQVHQVGAFEASFVPSPADFTRLDPRFRLPESAFEALPRYADFGFAVFKLRRTGGGEQEKQRYHPMAFSFPRRNSCALFFPTVHVHDGQVHATARFDHLLYMQLAGGWRPVAPWGSSYAPARTFANAERARGVLDPDALVHRLALGGEWPNRDVIVADGYPRAA